MLIPLDTGDPLSTRKGSTKSIATTLEIRIIRTRKKAATGRSSYKMAMSSLRHALSSYLGRNINMADTVDREEGRKTRGSSKNRKTSSRRYKHSIASQYFQALAKHHPTSEAVRSLLEMVYAV